MVKCLIALTILFSTMSSIACYNILMVVPTPIIGRWLYFEEFIRELLTRGHKITTLTSYNIRKEHENYTAVVIPALNINQIFASKNVFLGGYTGFKSLRFNWKLGLLNSEHVLSNSKVQDFLKNSENQFDLVVADQEDHESLFAFAIKFKCQLVTLSPSGYSAGLTIPTSFISHPLLHYANEMNFFERAYNLLFYTCEAAFRRLNYLPAQNRLVRKYLSDYFDGDIPQVKAIQKSTSIMLVNSHPILETPRPKMPRQIDIAGAHILQASLPSDLNDFFENAGDDGVIVFSFGTILKPEEMPAETIVEIVETFKKLKQRVLWKVDHTKLGIDILPPNVLTRVWIPQQKVLAHPKVVLFICHGGVLGVQEAIYHAVPILAIPIFNDQHKIAKKIESYGIGFFLRIEDLSRETFTAAIEKITTDSALKKNISEASEVFKDNAIDPMKKAMFWIEHTVRNNAARNQNVDISFCQYFSIDIWLFLLCVMISCFLCLVLTIKVCLRKYQSREQKGKFKYY